MKKKKTLRIAGIVVAVLAVILVLIEIFFTAPVPEDVEQQSAYYDPRLEELRERNAELDDIFEGTATHVDPEYSEDLFAAQGELSNFDTFSEPNIEDDANIDDADPHDFFDSAPIDDDTLIDTTQESFEAAASPFDHIPTNDTQDEMMVDSLAGTWNDSDHVPGEDSTEAEFSDLPETFSDEDYANTSHQYAGNDMDMGQLKELMDAAIDDAVQLALENKVSSDAALADTLAQHRRELDLISQRIDMLPDLTRQSVQDALDAHPGQDTELLLAAISERLETLETSLAEQRRQAARPSASQLRSLYRLERIAGNTVTLIGSNTGREFVFGLGDTIAYGGTVARIQGDSVTLQWPNAQATLSIY